MEARYGQSNRNRGNILVLDGLFPLRKRDGTPVILPGLSVKSVMGLADASLQIAAHLKERPGFELHIYEGYGHAAYDTAPDYKDRMLRFLSTEPKRL